MARKLIIAANWKMNKGPAETAEFIEGFVPGTEELSQKCDIVIAPPHVSIPAASLGQIFEPCDIIPGADD